MLFKPTSHWSSLCFISCVDDAIFKNHDNIWAVSILTRSHSTDRLSTFLLKTLFPLFKKNHGTIHEALYTLSLHPLDIQGLTHENRKEMAQYLGGSECSKSTAKVCFLNKTLKCSNVTFHNVIITLKFIGIWMLTEQIFWGSHSECSVHTIELWQSSTLEKQQDLV